MTHAPTTAGGPLHTPTTCWLCSRRAEGIGIGQFPSDYRPNSDPKFLCLNCIPLAAQLRTTTKFDHYESNAIDATIEAVGPLIGEFGSDLAEWTPEQRVEFVTAVILGFGTSIREQIRTQEVPF